MYIYIHVCFMVNFVCSVYVSDLYFACIYFVVIVYFCV